MYSAMQGDGNILFFLRDCEQLKCNVDGYFSLCRKGNRPTRILNYESYTLTYAGVTILVAETNPANHTAAHSGRESGMKQWLRIWERSSPDSSRLISRKA
jgi:hypothetical protein